jgi:cytochrome c oxidase cbb3-type subunit 3
MTEKPETPREDRLLEHEADGIREYDNPMPRWWLYILYATVIYAVLYWVNVIPGIGQGRGRLATYEAEMAKARIQREALAAQGGGAPTEAEVLAIVQDATRLSKGQERYRSLCVPCHRDDGGGSIGPNLTDDYWIHGGTTADLLRTVTTGVLEKGMPAWGQMMKPEELAAVVAYVTTLHGTHPPNPKEPQGVLVGSQADTSHAHPH